MQFLSKQFLFKNMIFCCSGRQNKQTATQKLGGETFPHVQGRQVCHFSRMLETSPLLTLNISLLLACNKL